MIGLSSARSQSDLTLCCRSCLSQQASAEQPIEHIAGVNVCASPLLWRVWLSANIDSVVAEYVRGSSATRGSILSAGLAAMRDFDPAYVSSGSNARITASQHFCPLHPNKQTPTGRVECDAVFAANTHAH